MTEKKVQILKVFKTFLPLYNFISGEQMKSETDFTSIFTDPLSPNYF